MYVINLTFLERAMADPIAGGPAGTSLDRVLVVDDDPATLLAVPALLQARLTHIVVDTAISGDHALASARNCSYDAILLDVRMPRMGGADLFKQLRTYLRETPIIVVTAAWDDALKQSMLAAGAFAFLTKPVEATHLIQTVARALNRLG